MEPTVTWFEPIVKVLLLALISLIAWWAKSFDAFARKKGENLATKSDIGAITREVEKVREEYTLRLEEVAQENRAVLQGMTQHHQLSLAAIDRRMEAHQEAFTLWLDLYHSIHSDRIGDEVRKCQDWFGNNALYLTAEARIAFQDAYMAAFHHSMLLRSPVDRSEVQDNWERIETAATKLSEAVDLPPPGGQTFSRVDAQGRVVRPEPDPLQETPESDRGQQI